MAEKKLVLKICCSDWKNASRDKRELGVCRDLGMDVLVLARGEDGKNDIVDGFDVVRKTSRPLGKCIPAGLNRIVALYTWAKAVRKIKPDIISGHDIDGLLIGYLSTILYRKKTKLVYDSHEFELGRERNTGHPLHRYLFRIGEKFLMSKSSLSIFVSKSIETEVLKIHKLSVPTVVVRNIPDYWKIDEEQILLKKEEILSNVKRGTQILMYHGAIFERRGIEAMLFAVSKLDNTVGFILGDGNECYLKSLHDLTKMLGITDRVYFHNAVPHNELMSYIGAATIGFAIIEPTSKSYFFSLPNKLFECIQALTPVIVSDFPELAAIVGKYQVGAVVEPKAMLAITTRINEVLTDENYKSLKQNLINAKKELCWEKEKLVLEKAYVDLCK